MSRRPRLLIVDQSLRDAGGHHYEYDLALCRAAKALGVPTVIGAHQSVPELEHLQDYVRPWFQKAWYESYGPPSQPVDIAESKLQGLHFLRRAARRILRPGGARPRPAIGLAAELLALIEKESLGERGHVLVHTFSIPELDSLIDIAAGRRRGLPAIHVILRRDAEESISQLGGKGGIRGSLSRLAASRSALAALRLYADTEELARQHEALAPGVKVGVVPIPHCLPSDEVLDPVRAAGPLRIVYLGDARDEKGFHLLPAAVEAVGRRFFAQGRARFIIQANIGAAGDSPPLVEARTRLAAYPESQVQLLTEQLSISAFHGLMGTADIVLLPYDREAYRRRSSGILVQALAAGRVVVVPTGTWMATQIDRNGAITFASNSELPEAVIAAIDWWSELSKRAQQRAASWRAQHNATHLVTRLLQSERDK